MTFPRPLSDSERTLTRWMLEHGHGDPEPFLRHLEQARVIRGCGCGCASVDFQIGEKPGDSRSGMQILADYVYGNPEQDFYGAFVFAKDDILAGLEVYALSGATPITLPRPEDLRPFKNVAEHDASNASGVEPVTKGHKP